MSQSLRDEERQAWQRLIRVIGHEINNSLAPIKSIAHSLERILAARSEAAGLGSRHAQRPAGDRRSRPIRSGDSRPPTRSWRGSLRRRCAPVTLGALVARVAGLERRMPMPCSRGRPSRSQADPDQLEQLLINLFRNAVDATLETRGGVIGELGRRRRPRPRCASTTRGRACSNTTNLFVPFFTTKPGGSGIGLVLSRQIAEAHGGTLTLENRTPAPAAAPN